VAKKIERTQGEAQAELQAWYLTDLRPKIANAAKSGKVTSLAAAALDRDLRQLLRISHARFQEAA
jgi:gluconate kinase